MDSSPPDRARRRCRRLRRHFAGAGRLAVHDVVLLDQSETCGPSDLMPHQYEDQWPDTTIFRGNIGDRGLADDSFTDVQRPMEFEPRAGPHTAWQRDGRQEAAALGVRVGCDLRLAHGGSSVAASAATGTNVITSSATSSRPIQDRKWSISINIFSVPAIWSPSQLHIGKIADSVAVGLVGIAKNRNVDEMGGRPIWPNVAIDLT